MDAELKDHEAERPEVSGVKGYDTTVKSSCERKQEQWESHREELYELYMMENRTLKKTMQIMRDKYNFTPRSAPHLNLFFPLTLGLFGRLIPIPSSDAEILT